MCGKTMPIDKNTLYAELEKRVLFQISTLNRLEEDMEREQTKKIKNLVETYATLCKLYSECTKIILEIKGWTVKDIESREEFLEKVRQLIENRHDTNNTETE